MLIALPHLKRGTLTVCLWGLFSCSPATAPPTPDEPLPSETHSSAPAPTVSPALCEDNLSENIPMPAPGSSLDWPEDIETGVPYLQAQIENTCHNPYVHVRAFQFTPGTCATLTLQNQESGHRINLGTHKVAGDTQIFSGFDSSPYPRGVYTLKLQSANGTEQAERELLITPCQETATPSPFTPTTEITPSPVKNTFLKLSPTSVCRGDEVTVSAQLSNNDTYALYIERPDPVEVKVPPLFGEHVQLAELQFATGSPTTYRFRLQDKLQDLKKPEKTLDLTPGRYGILLVSDSETLGLGNLTVKNCMAE